MYSNNKTINNFSGGSLTSEISPISSSINQSINIIMKLKLEHIGIAIFALVILRLVFFSGDSSKESEEGIDHSKRSLSLPSLNVNAKFDFSVCSNFQLRRVSALGIKTTVPSISLTYLTPPEWSKSYALIFPAGPSFISFPGSNVYEFLTGPEGFDREVTAVASAVLRERSVLFFFDVLCAPLFSDLVQGCLMHFQ
jgi:hypothetical protein